MRWNEINEKETVVAQEGNQMRAVPKEIAEEAYKEYVEQYGGNQSFDRLQERGGFSKGELIYLLYLRVKRLEGK